SGSNEHQPIRPSLLQIHANSLGKKNSRIKKREKTRGTQGAAGEYCLQLVQQVSDGSAVLHQNFISSPVRNGIHPAGAHVQENERNTQQKQQHAFADFEQRAQLKRTMPPRLLQNRRNVRGITHYLTLSRSLFIAQ